jgi:integrase
MARRARRPKGIDLDTVKVRAVRGPHRDDDQKWYWRAERYSGGGSHTVWTGWATRDEARKEASVIVAAGQEDVPQQPPASAGEEPEIRTVRDLLRYYGGWVKEHPQRAEKTKANVRRALGSLTRLSGDVLVERLDTATVEAFQQSRLREKAASGTVKIEVATLVAAWNWGRERGVTSDKALRRPRLKYEKTRDDFTPSPAEFEKVRLAATRPWARLCLEIAAGTGARMGEISRLEWDNVDLDGRVVTIREGEGKKTGRREVVVPDTLVAILSAVSEAQRKGRVLGIMPSSADSMLSVQLREYCDTAGVRRFTVHGIRRMVIDQYYTAGVDVGTVAQQLGQSPEVALRYYRQSTPAQRRRAVALAGLLAPSNVRALDTARKTQDG